MKVPIGVAAAGTAIAIGKLGQSGTEAFTPIRPGKTLQAPKPDLGANTLGRFEQFGEANKGSDMRMSHYNNACGNGYLNQLQNDHEQYDTDAQLQGLQTTLDSYNTYGNTPPLIHQLTHSADQQLSISFAEENQLLHLGITNNDLELCLAALSLGLDPNAPDANGYTPLQHAQHHNNEALTGILLQYGADPELKTPQGQTPLQLAGQTEHYGNVVELLLAGAKFDLGNNFFQAKNSGGRESVPQTSERMKNFMLNLKLLLQLNDAKTDGLEVCNEIIAKEKLVNAIKDEISPADLASCRRSIALDIQLRSTMCAVPNNENLSQANRRRCETLHQAMSTMTPHDFLWLSNGSTGHAINTVLYKNGNDDFEVSLINSGDGSEHHESNELNQIKPKTYRFQPPSGIDTTVPKQQYETQIQSALGFVYTSKYERGILDVNKLYKTMDSIADYRRGMNENGEKVPAYTRVVHRAGPPIDLQMADNCVTMSLLGAMKLLFPEEANSGKLEAKYESYLINEMQQEYPKLTRAHCDQISHLAQQKNDVGWTLQKARMLFAKGMANDSNDQEALEMLNESANLFDQAKQTLMLKSASEQPHDIIDIMAEANDKIGFVRELMQSTGGQY